MDEIKDDTIKEFAGKSADEIQLAILIELRMLNEHFRQQEIRGNKLREEAQIKANKVMETIPENMRAIIAPFVSI